MTDERKVGRHSVSINQKQSVSITGVSDVISFDEEAVVCDTEQGVLVINGALLHVNRLNLDSGELDLDGDIFGLSYEEQRGGTKGKGSLLNRIFK